MELDFFKIHDFAVLFCSNTVMRGMYFEFNAKRWHLKRIHTETVDPEKKFESLKEAVNKLNASHSMLVLTGPMENLCFFQHNSVMLSPREQRDALSMELSRKLLTPIDHPLVQFRTTSDKTENNRVLVNCAVFPAKNLKIYTNLLKHSGMQADNYCYPLLAVNKQSAPVYLPEYDADFFFHAGEWHRIAGREVEITEANKEWERYFRKKFVIPADITFDFKDFLSNLMIADMISSDASLSRFKEINVMPKEYRPVRYKQHLKISAVLVAVIIASWIWNGLSSKISNYSEYSRISAQISGAKRESGNIQRDLKRFAKKQKELNKVLGQSCGATGIIADMNTLAQLLPTNVLVSNLRFSESGIDLQLHSEDQNLDLPSILKPISNKWKIGQLQQRQGNDTVTAINLKLVPADELSVVSNKKDKSKK